MTMSTLWGIIHYNWLEVNWITRILGDRSFEQKGQDEGERARSTFVEDVNTVDTLCPAWPERDHDKWRWLFARAIHSSHGVGEPISFEYRPASPESALNFDPDEVRQILEEDPLVFDPDVVYVSEKQTAGAVSVEAVDAIPNAEQFVSRALELGKLDLSPETLSEIRNYLVDLASDMVIREGEGDYFVGNIELMRFVCNRVGLEIPELGKDFDPDNDYNQFVREGVNLGVLIGFLGRRIGGADGGHLEYLSRFLRYLRDIQESHNETIRLYPIDDSGQEDGSHADSLLVFVEDDCRALDTAEALVKMNAPDIGKESSSLTNIVVRVYPVSGERMLISHRWSADRLREWYLLKAIGSMLESIQGGIPLSSGVLRERGAWDDGLALHPDRQDRTVGMDDQLFVERNGSLKPINALRRMVLGNMLVAFLDNPLSVEHAAKLYFGGDKFIESVFSRSIFNRGQIVNVEWNSQYGDEEWIDLSNLTVGGSGEEANNTLRIPIELMRTGDVYLARANGVKEERNSVTYYSSGCDPLVSPRVVSRNQIKLNEGDVLRYRGGHREDYYLVRAIGEEGISFVSVSSPRLYYQSAVEELKPLVMDIHQSKDFYDETPNLKKIYRLPWQELLKIYATISWMDGIREGEQQGYLESITEKRGANTLLGGGGKKAYDENVFECIQRELAAELHTDVTTNLIPNSEVVGITRLVVLDNDTETGEVVVDRQFITVHLVWRCDRLPSLRDFTIDNAHEAQGDLLIRPVGNVVHDPKLSPELKVGGRLLERAFTGDGIFVNDVAVDKRGIPIGVNNLAWVDRSELLFQDAP